MLETKNLVMIQDVEEFLSSIYQGVFEVRGQQLLIGSHCIELPDKWTVERKKKLYSDMMKVIGQC